MRTVLRPNAMTPRHLLRRSLPATLAALATVLGAGAACAAQALPAPAMAAIERLIERQTTGLPGKAGPLNGNAPVSELSGSRQCRRRAEQAVQLGQARVEAAGVR